MKKYLNYFQILTIIILFYACTSKNCKDKTEYPKQDVLNVLSLQFEAWNNANLEKFMEGYEKSDSIQFITKNGRVWGWNNIYEKYKKTYFDKNSMGTLTFENMDVKFLSNNTAQVYGNWKVQNDIVFGGVFSVFLRKKNEQWRIFIDHTW